MRTFGEYPPLALGVPPPASIDTPVPVAGGRLPLSPAGNGRQAVRVWLSGGTCGLITAGFVYVLMLAGSLGFLGQVDVGKPLHVLQFLVLNVLLAMAMWAHLATMLTDPGAIPALPKEQLVDRIPRSSPRLMNGEWVTSCHVCNCYKPERAHHCSSCGRCIRRMDHHCPCKKQ